MEILKKAGLDVEVGILREKCERLNEAFFHWITTGRPFVLLKLAATLDGKIATASGDSKWITGGKAREKVRDLRCWADAVMVGGETARTDHPSLTVRGIPDWNQPKRIVVSRELTTDSAGELLGDGPSPLIVSAETREEWLEVLSELGSDGVTALLVEGGGILASSLLFAGIVDKLAYFIAPKILGGEHSRPAVSGKAPSSLTEAIRIENIDLEKIGDDILVTGYPLNLITVDG